MLTLALALLATLGSGSSLEHDVDLDPYGPEPPDFRKAPPKRADPCGGRAAWVGDGDDGRDPLPCEGPDADVDHDPGGLHEPDWLRTGDDAEPP